ncbi:MAG: hypothetical protein M1133_01335 [Armatimonadetes bacterium]|nr:hypothetical protein [Armatimonadota bacterium]
MAYHLTSGTATNTADMLVKLKDFLVTTCGWSLHDDGSAQAEPYYVLKSVGESGNEDIYIQFINDTANLDCISVKGYLYWNATTHVGVKVVFSSAATMISAKDAAQFLYWLYGDLDHVFIVTKIVATYYGHYSGVIKRFWSAQTAISQGAVTAGSNVVVPVDDASILTVNKSYIIKDDANIERVQVTARDTVSTPNTVTIATLVSGYGAGSKIGEDPQPVIIGKNVMPGSCYGLNRWNGYSSATAQTMNCGAANGGFATSCDPDARYSLVTMFPWLVANTGTGYEELRGELIEVYSTGSGAGDSEDVIDLGTVTYKMFNISTAGWCAVKE